MGRGSTDDYEQQSLLPDRGLLSSRALACLAEDLTGTLEAEPGLGSLHALSWLLLEADRRSFGGLTGQEINAVFKRVDPQLYGLADHSHLPYLLANAKKSGLISRSATGGSHVPTERTRAYLEKQLALPPERRKRMPTRGLRRARKIATDSPTNQPMVAYPK